MVERLLAKQKAAGSRPAYRTNFLKIFLFICHNSLMKFRLLPLLFLLSSCGGGPSSDSNSDDDRSITNPPNSLISCTKALNTNVCNFEHNGLERSFFIHAPTILNSRIKYHCFLLYMDLEVVLKELWDIQISNLLLMKTTL